MDWFTDLISRKYEKIGEERGEKIGEARGERRGERRGRDKTLLQAYLNMKNAACKDNFICTMLGISTSKLRKIKRMAVVGDAQTVKNV